MLACERQFVLNGENDLCQQGTVALPRNLLKRIVWYLKLVYVIDMPLRHKNPHQRPKLGKLMRREPHRFDTEKGRPLAAEFPYPERRPLGTTQTGRSDYEPKGELAIYASRLFSAPIDKKVHRVGLEKEKLALPLS